MIIQLAPEIREAEFEALLHYLESIHYKSSRVQTQFGDYVIAIGKKEFDIRAVGVLPGVRDIHRVSDDYKLVSKKWKVEDTRIDLGGGTGIGTGNFAVMAGPCSIESEAQVTAVLDHLQRNGISIMRGGVYKPRSSPYSFRGMGLDGLKMWHALASERGIRIITEVMTADQIDDMLPYVDALQIGARNAQNFNLLDAVGKVDKPVLLKRGISGTLDELLHAAEYIFSNGNEKIMLCERGIRTYETAYRNTMDINAITVLKEKTHLPVIADPSHGIGVRKFVPSVALACIMAGADGLIIEVHEAPERAISDGQQTLNFSEAQKLYPQLQQAFALREEFKS